MNKKDGSGKLGDAGITHTSIRHTVIFLWHYAKPYLKDLIKTFAISLPLICMGWVIPWVFKRITELFVQNTPLNSLILWLIIGLFVVSLRSIFEIITRYIMTILHVKLSNDIRNDIYEYTQKNSLTFHVQNRTGELSSLVTNDSFAAAAGVLEIYSSLWQDPAIIISLICVMLYFNPILSVFSIISVPVISLLVTKAGKKAHRAENDFLDRQGKILGWMVESLVNIKQVKSFNLEEQRKKKFAAYGEDLILFRKKALIPKLVLSPITEILSSLTLILMGIVAYYQLAGGHSTSGDIVGCLTAAISLKKPIKSISNSYITLQQSIAAVGRISWVIGMQKDKNEDIDFNEPVNEIAFKNIEYSYDGSHTILKQISFELHKGERVAVIGKSGAGKTTLIDLLIGFFPSQKGEIEINGKKLRQIDPVSWRKHIGVVTQEPFLFDTTIEENIRMGDPSASNERINEVIEMAGCHEIICRLPQGLKTDVGERGVRLSGGERKRIALARALIRPISVLILDEATGELDHGTEKGILETIDKLSSDLIIIHVSHRDSVLDYCDRALMISHGQLQELSIKECREKIRAKINDKQPGMMVRRRAVSVK
ncbi:ABC transporter ATP-binding protein [uncultured Desulfobacter sp.]|uniref:ABC transporter ATP-binding protein n=1 Tax=uncultured Desulfobacter sp. TaxID=240139 RepID=UPI002AAAB021|nr:ABC transporter ATP-binding protein [uncultured Desulfobacter sp.]